MANKQSYFVCNNCGSRQLKWVGRCPDCGEWDSLSQQQSEFTADPHRPDVALDDTGPVELTQAAQTDHATTDRLTGGVAELDRVLGGGLVTGSTVLLGGAPGIGKSTLLLHLAGTLGNAGHRVMYVTSEESARQIAMRAGRLGIGGENISNILIDAQTNLEVILTHIRQHQPAVVMIDSVQLVYKPALSAAPGSVSQMRQCGTELVWLAKAAGTVVVLVGHVTKQGMIAGPKILEHIVDVVLHVEGDRHHAYRLVRAAKNRFGSTNELGIFEMTDTGLRQVDDPSALFLQRDYPLRPGRVTFAASEGSRILLVEVQALTAPAIPGLVKRKATGIGPNRLAMILAVLERHANVKLANMDVFVNIVGGLKITEPAADLPVALAVAGAAAGRTLPDTVLAFGELGLLGEIRPVPLAEKRTAEAIRHRFQHVATAPTGKTDPQRDGKIKIHPCFHLQQALKLLE